MSSSAATFAVTFVHPTMGREQGIRHIRTWEMPPLAPAVLKAVTPDWVDFRFYDDRLEEIPYDEPTDLAAISVETFTAKRAYQIASEFRRRGVPVVMGGFHATLVPDEVVRWADCVVTGEAEQIWPEVLEDARAGRMQRRYDGGHPELGGVTPDRSIYSGKRYLPIATVETGRGCPFTCEFCAVRTFYGNTRRYRPVEEVIAEVSALPEKSIFFVDDNMLGDSRRSRDLLKGLAACGKRWLTQSSIDVGFDDELLELAAKAGCAGVLVGLESLVDRNLEAMDKNVNLANRDYAKAIEGFRRHGIWNYATFLLGYDFDEADTPERLLDFALGNQLFLCGFNHVTPFPGTDLYDRLLAENRLRFDTWWLDDRYRYDMIPYVPLQSTPESVEATCYALRKRFYGIRSLFARGTDLRANCKSPGAALLYWFVGLSMYRDVRKRDGLMLGDATVTADLLPAVEPEFAT